MDKYIIDFTGVKTVWYFYEAIEKGLKLPEWFGKNLDALWDMLTGFIDCPTVIYFKGVNSLPEALDKKMESVLRVFTKAVNYYAEGEFEFEIID